MRRNILLLTVALVLFSVGCVHVPPVVAQEPSKKDTQNKQLKEMDLNLRILALEYENFKHKVERAKRQAVDFKKLEDQRAREYLRLKKKRARLTASLEKKPKPEKEVKESDDY